MKNISARTAACERKIGIEGWRFGQREGTSNESLNGSARERKSREWEEGKCRRFR